MEYNLITAGIELIGTTITKLSIDNTIESLSKEAKRSLGINIHEPRTQKAGENFVSSLVVDFEIIIEQDEGKTCRISLTIEGEFYSHSGMDEKTFITLVAINGAAAIIGITRGKVEAVSANVFNDGKIVIPFVNVVEYYRSVSEKKSRTSTRKEKNNGKK